LADVNVAGLRKKVAASNPNVRVDGLRPKAGTIEVPEDVASQLGNAPIYTYQGGVPVTTTAQAPTPAEAATVLEPRPYTESFARATEDLPPGDIRGRIRPDLTGPMLPTAPSIPTPGVGTTEAPPGYIPPVPLTEVPSMVSEATDIRGLLQTPLGSALAKTTGDIGTFLRGLGSDFQKTYGTPLSAKAPNPPMLPEAPEITPLTPFIDLAHLTMGAFLSGTPEGVAFQTGNQALEAAAPNVARGLNKALSPAKSFADEGVPILKDIKQKLPELLDAFDLVFQLAIFAGAKRPGEVAEGIRTGAADTRTWAAEGARTALSRKIADVYTPEALRDVYLRVNRGTATPQEAELVRRINDTFSAPGEAVRRGVSDVGGREYYPSTPAFMRRILGEFPNTERNLEMNARRSRRTARPARPDIGPAGAPPREGARPAPMAETRPEDRLLTEGPGVAEASVSPQGPEPPLSPAAPPAPSGAPRPASSRGPIITPAPSEAEGVGTAAGSVVGAPPIQTRHPLADNSMFSGDTAQEILEKAIDDRSHGDEDFAEAAAEVWDDRRGRGENDTRKLSEAEQDALLGEIEARANKLREGDSGEGDTTTEETTPFPGFGGAPTEIPANVAGWPESIFPVVERFQEKYPGKAIFSTEATAEIGAQLTTEQAQEAYDRYKKLSGSKQQSQHLREVAEGFVEAQFAKVDKKGPRTPYSQNELEDRLAWLQSGREPSEYHSPIDTTKTGIQGEAELPPITPDPSTLPKVETGDMVEGLEVQEDIPNTSSIEASLGGLDYNENGVRVVPMSDFGEMSYRSTDDQAKVRKLTEAIDANGKIKPLIVVYGDGDPYVLEGGHRLAALQALGKKEFPALVVNVEQPHVPEGTTLEDIDRSADTQLYAYFMGDKGWGLHPVKGKVYKSQVAPTHEFFTHKLDDRWYAVEARSGQKIVAAGATTRDGAMKQAEDFLRSLDSKVLEDAILNKINQTGLSPRYKVFKKEAPASTTTTPQTVKDRNGVELKVGDEVMLATGIKDRIVAINPDGTVAIEGKHLSPMLAESVPTRSIEKVKESGTTAPTPSPTPRPGEPSVPAEAPPTTAPVADRMKAARENMIDRLYDGALVELEASDTYRAGTPEQQDAQRKRILALYEKSATKLFTAIEAKDIKTLKEILHRGNANSKKAFSEATGVKLPKTDKGTFKALDEWALDTSTVKEAAATPAQGSTVTLYHGRRGPQTFDPGKPIFFADKENDAEFYAHERGPDDEPAGISSNEVEIKNPATLEQMVEIAKKIGVEFAEDDTGYPYIPEVAKHSPYDGTNELDLVYIPRVQEALKAAGYDSVKAFDPLENYEIPVTVIFDPSQIKGTKIKHIAPGNLRGQLHDFGKVTWTESTDPDGTKRDVIQFEDKAWIQRKTLPAPVNGITYAFSHGGDLAVFFQDYRTAPMVYKSPIATEGRPKGYLSLNENGVHDYLTAARRIVSDKEDVDAATTEADTEDPSPHVIAVRKGEIDPNGAWFSLPGASTYHNPIEAGGDALSYNLAGAKLALTDSHDMWQVLGKALELTDNPDEITAIREVLQDDPEIQVNYVMVDNWPAITEAAKALGYDGLHVWGVDDTGSPTSVFLWNTDKAKLLTSPEAQASKAKRDAEYRADLTANAEDRTIQEDKEDESGPTETPGTGPDVVGPAGVPPVASTGVPPGSPQGGQAPRIPQPGGRKGQRGTRGAASGGEAVGGPSGGSGVQGGNQPPATGERPGGDTDAGKGVAGNRGVDANAPTAPADRNIRISESFDVAPGGSVTRTRNNLKAIELLKKLEAENRNPSPEEKNILAQYVGWGGLSQVFDRYNKDLGKFYDDVKAALTPQEWSEARDSTINAHYTSSDVIRYGLWAIAERLGIKDGNILEPSAGIGHVIGMAPDAIADAARFALVELDSISGRITRKLYPQSKVHVMGVEKAPLRANHFNLAIGNVPFGKTAPYDPRYPKLSLHNYFFARMLDTVKPGGLVVAITSNSTMDNATSAAAREYLADRADLVGAIRLPNNAFSKNAGTEVTTDIIILRKKDGAGFTLGQRWHDAPVQTVEKGEYPLNEYYIAHPEMMLGTMGLEGTMYRGDTPTLSPTPGAVLKDQLTAAVAKLPEKVFGVGVGIKSEDEIFEAEEAEYGDIEGSFKKDAKGNVYQVVDGTRKLIPKLKPDGKPDPFHKRVEGYIAIRDKMRELEKMEKDPESDPKLVEKKRSELNTVYDNHVKRNGNLTGIGHKLLKSDVDYYPVSGLEIVKKTVTNEGGRWKYDKTIEKSDILKKRFTFPREEPQSAGSIADALSISLMWRGMVDPAYIGELVGQPAERVKQALLDNELAYENPDTGVIEPPDVYLSGKVRQKYNAALSRIADNPEYQKNVDALAKVLPAKRPIQAIAFRPGTQWVPVRVYDDYIRDTFKVYGSTVRYTPQTGTWTISNTKAHSAANHNEWGVTSKMSGKTMTGLQILEKAMNSAPIEIKYAVDDGDGGKTYLTDHAATLQANMNAKKLVGEGPTAPGHFEKWVRERNQYHDEIEEIFNETYNGIVKRESTIPPWTHYPGASHAIVLRDKQKGAINRGVTGPSMGLFHAVGTGKTYIQITIAMEWKRLGKSRKTVIVPQNATTEQFAKSAKLLYPTARILAPSEAERSTEQRKRLLSVIKTNDWDIVILPQSFVELIEDSPARVQAFIQEEIDVLEEVIRAEKAKEGKNVNVKNLVKRLKTLRADLDKLADRKVDKDMPTWEELGVEGLIVDEAHAYKKLGLITSMDRVKGIDVKRSDRALGMYMKVRHVRENAGGGNVIMSTGTPITNTMAEVWTWFRYLRPDLLRDYKIETFDAFANSFGRIVEDAEQTATGRFKTVSRFRKFINAPALIRAFLDMADVVLAEDAGVTGLPTLKNGKVTNIMMKRTPELEAYIKTLARRMEQWEKLSGAAKREQRHVPLVMHGLARMAAIDLRLINPEAPDAPGSKTNMTVEHILNKLKETEPQRGTIAVFSDRFQSPEIKEKYLDDDEQVLNPAYGKHEFNLFQDMKKKLIARGVPAAEIAVIHDYKSSAAREALFNMMNEGTIRVLFGTTDRMGIGVNIQERLEDLIHMDVPDRPMDVQQREGRIMRTREAVRLGAPPPEVEIAAMGVEKTMDTMQWRRNYQKIAFANQILRGDVNDMELEDPTDESQMSYGELMAALTGNELAMQRFVLESQILRIKSLAESHASGLGQLKNEIDTLNRVTVPYLEGQLKVQTAGRDKVKAAFPDGKATTVEVEGKTFTGEDLNKQVKEWLSAQFSAALKDYHKNNLLVDLKGWPTLLPDMKVNGMTILSRIITELPKVSGEKPPQRLMWRMTNEGVSREAIMDGEAKSPEGFIMSMRARLDKFDDQIAGLTKQLAQSKQDVTDKKELLTRPWEGQSELAGLVKKLEDVNNQLIAEGSELDKERKAAEGGPPEKPPEGGPPDTTPDAEDEGDGDDYDPSTDLPMYVPGYYEMARVSQAIYAQMKVALEALAETKAFRGKNRTSVARNIARNLARATYIASINPRFKRVSDSLRDTELKLNALETDVVSQLHTAWSSLSKAEGEALAEVIYRGNEEEGVFTDRELRSLYRMNDQQVEAYHRIRQAQDMVLDLARDEKLYPLTEAMGDLREKITATEDRIGEIEAEIMGDPNDTRLQRKLVRAEETLDSAKKALNNTHDRIREISTYFQMLKDQGYISLKREGDIVVVAEHPTELDEFGKSKYVYDHATNIIEAGRIAKAFKAAGYDQNVKQYKAKNLPRSLMAGMHPSEFESIILQSKVDPGSPEIQRIREQIYSRYGGRSYELKREYIPGYKRTRRNVTKAITRQLFVKAGGYYNTVGRSEAMKALNESGMDRVDNRLYKFTLKFIDAETRKQERSFLAEKSAQARQLLYFWLLGGDVMQFVLNAVGQPISMNYNYLAQDLGGGLKGFKPEVVFVKAMRLSGQAMRGDAPAEFQAMYDRAKREKIVTAEFAQALAESEIGEVGKVMHYGSIFQQAGEKVTRSHMFAAAYISGQMKGLTGEELYQFCVDAVDRTQGRFRSGEAPGVVRMTGEVGRSIYQFNSFSQLWAENLANAMRSDFKGKMPRATLRAIFGLGVMGGLKALPLMGLAFLIYKLLTGEDPEKKVEDVTGEDTLVRDLALYGATGSAGVSNRVGFYNQVPEFNREFNPLDKVALWSAAKTMYQGASDIAGGDYQRGIENLMPRAIRGPLRAYRLSQEGYKTRAGKTLIPKDQIDALTLLGQSLNVTPEDVVEYYNRKALGFGQKGKRLNLRNLKPKMPSLSPF
jgi:N12 class adenine-specific DNA methylase